jgi:ribosomal protein S1
MDDAALSMLRAQVALLEARIEEAEAEGAFHFRDGPGFQEGAQDEYHRGIESYSFRPTITDDGTGIDLEAGDIMLGPASWIEIAASAPSVSESNTHVWLQIDVAAKTHTMEVGSKSAMMAAWSALSEDAKAKTMIYPIIETVWEDGTITKVRRLLDAIIPRAAG